MFEVEAEAYDRFVGRYAGQLARALCDFAGVTEGVRAVDVGCGPGALASELVSRLGADHVVGVEPSASFAAACRARLRAVAVVEARAEELPFPDGAFDVALAQLVVNFLEDPLAGVSEMRRVTRGGGTVVAAVWDYAVGNVLLRRFWDAVIAFDPAAAARAEGRTMRLATAESLLELWVEAGLLDVRATDITVTADYDGFADLWEPFLRGVGPAGAYVVSLDATRRDALAAGYRDQLGVADEPFSLPARAWAVSGRVP